MQGTEGMVGGSLENNRHCFFPRSLPSCNLLLPVKTKAASCKCLFDFFFIYTVYLSTALIVEVKSHPVRA